MKTTLEIWLPIKGYEGLYEVSNFGRIKSLPRNGTPGKILKPFSYLERSFVILCKEGKKKRFRVHRLEAEAFIPNPLNLPQVNHKDENPQNNFIWVNPDGTVDFEKSNLEWCTCKYNCNYGTHVKRVTEKISKRVAQYSLDGVLIAIYSSTMEAYRQTGIPQPTISACCCGRLKTAHGYIWRYLE